MVDPTHDSIGGSGKHDAVGLDERRPHTRYARLGTEDPLSALPPTGRTILAASRAIVARDGMQGLTIDAIVEETKVNRSAIRYYFGNKAGLLAAVVDSLLHDTAAAVSRETSKLPGGAERVDAFVLGMKAIADDSESFGVFFNIVGETMRNDQIKAHMAELYRHFYDLHLNWLGGSQTTASEDLKALARLLVAVTDGLGAQRLLEGADLDLGPPLALFSRMVRSALGDTT